MGLLEGQGAPLSILQGHPFRVTPIYDKNSTGSPLRVTPYRLFTGFIDPLLLFVLVVGHNKIGLIARAGRGLGVFVFI